MEIEILNQEKMDNYNFTKGKWEYLYDGCDHCYDIVSDNEFICTTMSGNTKAKADALLISKAPEMLELLQSLVSSEMTPLTIRKQAKQLIKEATEL